MTARTTTIVLQPGESVTIQAAASTVPPGGTTPPDGGGTTPPVNPPVNPPAAGSVDLGDLLFDGSQKNSTGVTGTVVAYARIVVPNPLPAGWAGKQAYVSVFESASGTYAKRMYLARQPCDYSAVYPAYGEGNGSANIYMMFAATSDYAVTLQAGEVWYVTIKNERPDGTPSCPEGGNGNFGIRMYPPNN